MKRIALLLICVANIIGCAVQPPVELPRFVGVEHDRYLGQGTSAIQGQGFLRQKGGAVVTCAGSKVLMFPATPFFQEFIAQLRAGRRVAAIEKVDPAYKPILKQGQCDAQGNFAFVGLPTGAWYVVTEVKWTVGHNQQGGALLREVQLSEGQTQQVLLSGDDFVGR